MKILILSIIFASTAFAGFKLPSYVFNSDQVAEASAAAQEKGKPLVFLIAGEKSN